MEAHNPYLDIYNSYNCGSVTGGDISSRLAQLVASQAALLHNALGYAIRDLVRIVSLKYIDDGDRTSGIEESIMKRISEDNGRLGTHLNEVIDSEELSIMSEEKDLQQDEAPGNEPKLLVFERSRVTVQADPPLKRNIVNIEDDDPPNTGTDFMEYAFRTKRPSQQESKQQTAQLRNTMKCCRCSRLCEPVRHSGNLYCSKCMPANGSVF